jgi:UDP-glucose 4-epimerase
MFQFIHEFDMATIISEALSKLPTGVFNVAGDDVISLHQAVEVVKIKKIPLPLVVLAPFAKIITPVWKFPHYLIDYIKYPSTLDNSELKKYLGNHCFRFSAEEALALLKLH